MANNRLLFFDTETSGLPRGAIAHNPGIHCLEIAGIWQSDGTRSPSRRQMISLLVQPGTKAEPALANYTIEPGAFNAHGITREYLAEFGIDSSIAFSTILDLIRRSDTLIGHNLEFDIKILRIWAMHLGASEQLELAWKHKELYCTMQAATPVCRIASPRGGYKWPKLEELYKFLFAKSFDGAHQAFFDIQATRNCYFELILRGVKSPQVVL